MTAHTIDDVLAAVAAETTKVDSIIALLQGVENQLADALSGTTVSPATQAKIDSIFDNLTTSAAKIDTAIAVAPGPLVPTP